VWRRARKYGGLDRGETPAESKKVLKRLLTRDTAAHKLALKRDIGTSTR